MAIFIHLKEMGYCHNDLFHVPLYHFFFVNLFFYNCRFLKFNMCDKDFSYAYLIHCNVCPMFFFLRRWVRGIFFEFAVCVWEGGGVQRHIFGNFTKYI